MGSTEAVMRLLTRLEEQQLGDAVQTGLAAVEQLKTTVDPKLKELARLGKRAEDTLVRHNTGLVAKRAHAVARKEDEFDDLMQDGMAGLLHAVRKFDPTKGFKLSTYAMNWIAQYQRRGLELRSLTIPPEKRITRTRLRHVADELQRELSREPTAAEIAERSGETEHLVRSIMASAVVYDKLDHDIVANQSDGVDVAEQVIGDLDSEHLAVCLQKLKPVETEVLKRRFGLHGDPTTRRALIDEMGLSDAHLASIEKVALAKMRHPAVGL